MCFVKRWIFVVLLTLALICSVSLTPIPKIVLLSAEAGSGVVPQFTLDGCIKEDGMPFCLNDGFCIRNAKNHQPSCECLSGYYGEFCEKNDGDAFVNYGEVQKDDFYIVVEDDDDYSPTGL